MKNIIKSLFAAAIAAILSTGCVKQYEPMSSYVTIEQISRAQGAYDGFVSAITSTMIGQFPWYGSGSAYPCDLGYPALGLMRDVMGSDYAEDYLNWWSAWYEGDGLGQTSGYTQIPWTYYYSWIKSANTVLQMAGEEPDADKLVGAGKALVYRAYLYLDMARMYSAETYAKNQNAETVPIVTETTTLDDLAHNPRATNKEMYEFILSDLDKAEKYLANYTRSDKYTPDLSVVYGIKARAYLTMEDWANAEKYAKLAQQGYRIMTAAEYTDRDNGFNTPNSSWMLALTYKADDPAILVNDSDSNWASQMCLEIDPFGSGCGYASNYGQHILIDRHLYETVPATDCRKKCYVDFAINDLIELNDDDELTPASKAAMIQALSAYSDYPDWVLDCGMNSAYLQSVGGLSLKFRVAGGSAGHYNQYIGFVVAYPMMRVEEMYLIEAEAAGMQNEAKGIELLTAFAKNRDPQYSYGSHNEAYYNNSTSRFQNEVWWQRRIEFWGEGLSTFDIKRLGKGIIRSYEGTNHADGYQWNLETYPMWMNLTIVQTETNYNTECSNNTDPVPPTGNSAPYVW